MFGKRLFHFILALSVVVTTLVSWRHVLADSGRVTKGDVQALFSTWNTGLRALRFISGNIVAAPLDAFQSGLIHAFGSDGSHYCADDWHVIMTAWVTGDDSLTYQQAVADLSLESTFILDGEVISITETPVVRRVAPLFFKDEYGFALGRILSPADLGVGEHTLTYIFTFPDGVTEQNTITFYVDSSDSDTCAQ